MALDEEARLSRRLSVLAEDFAIVFGIGVVSGLVMGYELGLNWSGYTDKVGAILGPLLTYETMTAFFLEAGFLGVMLFGMKRVGPRLHFAATCAVAFGTHVSAFWILAGNSWMQTPQGDKIVDGRFVPTNWLAIIFNPSMPYRFVHMMGAAYLSVALMVGAVGAWHVLRDRKNDVARLMLSMALWMVLFAAPCQIVAGDVQGDNTLQYQPQKVAAMEGTGPSRRRARGSRCTFRHSQHGDGEEPGDDRDSARCVVVPDAYVGRDDQGAPGVRQGRYSVRSDRVLRVPRDGRAGDADAGARRARRVPAPARRALPDALVPVVRGGDGAGGLSCDAGGMDRHRDGPPALYRLWAAADGEQRLSDRGARRGGLARGFRRRLRHRFRCGGDLPAPADGEGARARRARRAEPSDPQRRITPGPAGVMHQAPGGAE